MNGDAAGDDLRLSAPRALLLDLDGTLIDSAPDIAAALATVLTARNCAPLPLKMVRMLVGHGIARLVHDAFELSGISLPEQELATAQAEMTNHYDSDLVARTALMPGAANLVSYCARHRIAVACVTNKPAGMARRILEHFGVSPPITIVIGGDSGLARKPSPEPLLAAITQLRIARRAAWMVGDGLPDHRAARAAGMVSVAVNSDYGEPYEAASEATICVDSLDRLVDRLDTLIRTPA